MAQVKNLWSILRARFPEKEYALMQEVSDAAGFNRSRSADYIAVNMWPSRGLGINGIELKSFRSDWLSELKKPNKAENIFKYCDYFWLLTTDDTIANIDEIPVTWGWLCVNGKKIKTMKDAPKLNPVPLDKNFLVALLKRAVDKTNFIHLDAIQEKIEAEKEQAILIKERQISNQLKRAEELQIIVSEFEKSSGMRFGSWGGFKAEKIGEAVKFIINGGAERVSKDLIALKSKADYIQKEINSAIENLSNEKTETEHNQS